MSLITDIIQLVGTGSVPVVVGGSVLGVFELGERLASQRAKDALSKWLVSFDVQKAKALPDGTQDLFEKIFGKRHFSLKCFGRSAAFSMGAMAFIGLLVVLTDPGEVFKMIPDWVKPALLLLAWLPFSILVDYISLFKTRVILLVLTRMRRRNKVIAVAILAIDYVVYRLLFVLGVIVTMLLLSIEPFTGQPLRFDLDVNDFTVQSIVSFITMSPDVGETGWFFIFFWAGFAPSLWMWLYVLAIFVTRGLLRSERIVNWLRWGLDVEKTPFRSIGAVATALAFIASVAIILLSAAVSRITAAA